MATEERETGNLIGSDKVEGTAVYGADGERIGSIERIMIDKLSGKASYAVLGFGGFLGIGNEHYPLTWSTLKYNTQLGGYQVAVTEDQLRSTPATQRVKSWLRQFRQSRASKRDPKVTRKARQKSKKTAQFQARTNFIRELACSYSRKAGSYDLGREES